MTFHDGDLNRFPTSHRTSRSRVTHAYHPWQGLFHIMSIERTRREGFPGDQPTEEFRKASGFTSSGETGALPTESPMYRLPLNLKKPPLGDNLGPKGLAAKGLRGFMLQLRRSPPPCQVNVLLGESWGCYWGWLPSNLCTKLVSTHWTGL